MLENLRDTPPINTRIKKPSNILPPPERRLKQAIKPSSSHPSSVHPTKHFTERDTVIRRQLTPYKAKKAKSTSANESPERSSVSQKTQISNPNHDIPQSIAPIIDLLVEEQETKLDIQRKEATATSLLQMQLESKNLPPIELTRFDGDHCKWPIFIQNFKNRVHEKHSFTDDIRMERLISVLDGDAKRAVAAVGHSGLFYASALKLLKQDFGNPLVVSYKKVKAVLDQPQIQPNDKTLLRRYHQSLRSTVIWLKSMGYNSAIQSVENVTKAVMRLPRFMR